MTVRLPKGIFEGGKWIHFLTHIGYHLCDSDLDVKARANMLSPQTRGRFIRSIYMFGTVLLVLHEVWVVFLFTVWIASCVVYVHISKLFLLPWCKLSLNLSFQITTSLLLVTTCYVLSVKSTCCFAVNTWLKLEQVFRD